MTAHVNFYADLELHGNLILVKNNEELPTSVPFGTFAKKDNIIYLYTLVSGISTWFPLTEKKNTYIHTQGLANQIWVVNHNLNTENVWFFVKDNNGQPMHVGLKEKTLNSLVLEFPVAVLGHVIVIGSAEISTQQITTSALNVANGVVIADATGLYINGVAVGTGGGSGGPTTASNVSTDTSNFTGTLSASDDTTQKALETLNTAVNSLTTELNAIDSTLEELLAI